MNVKPKIFSTPEEALAEMARMDEEEFLDESDDEEESDCCEIEEKAPSEEEFDDSEEDPDFEPSESDVEREISENIQFDMCDLDGIEAPSTVKKKNSSKKKRLPANTITKKQKTNTGQALAMPGPSYQLIEVDEDYVMGKNNITKWSKSHGKTEISKTPKKNIVHKRVNTLRSAASASTPLECFKAFFTPELLQIVLQHTNEEIELKKAQFSDKRKNSCTFKPMQAEELDGLLSFFILAGATKNNHMPAAKLFDSTICGEKYQSTLSLNRFRFLSASLRFDNRLTRDERKESNKFAHISQIWDILINQCNLNYEPSMYLTIDEQLVGFRGRCPFKMYIPSKPNKYGLKIILLCDQGTRYMINAIPYLGKGSNPTNAPSAEYFTKKLIEPLKGSNRNLTGDNWFTSIPLAEELLEKYNITYIGTIKKNKPQLPVEFTDMKYQNRQVGSSLFIFRNNLTAVSYMPKKNKLVALVSTLHDDNAVNEHSGKPEIILNYNETKGAVDTFDQMCQYMNCGRKTKRWPVCIFYNMLNIACINAFIIYQFNFFKHNKNFPKKPLSRLDFMIKLAEELSEAWMHKRLEMPLSKALRSSIHKSLKIEEKTKTSDPLFKNRKRAYCSYCNYKIQRKSKMVCNGCAQPICGEHHKKMCPQCA